MRNKFIRIYFAILAACGYQLYRPATLEVSDPPAVVQEIDQEPVIPQLSDKPQLQVKNTDISGATFDEYPLVQSAVDQANVIMNTECFRNRILGADFTETNGLTNSQILNLISSKPMNIKIHIYYGSWRENYIYKTMGKDIGDGTVYMNRYFVKTAKVMRSLLVHEAEGHGQGFHHYSAKNSSVPYTLNLIIEECGEALGI